MDVYIYQADIYSAEAGEAIRARLTAEGKAPADINDESSYDSDAFPKGPYPNGGGEADTPQHCDDTGEFLENPLTPVGDAYVRAAAAPFEREGDSWDEIATRAEAEGKPVVGQWVRFYFAEGQ